jgi:hypothetical protein
MTSKISVERVENLNGTNAVVLNNISLAGRYRRRIYTQVDTANYSTTTTWALGPSFQPVSDFSPRSVIRLDYQIPTRNDSTSWGGGYIEPQVRFNEDPWQSLGSAGYDAGVMSLGFACIASFHQTIFIDPNILSTYSTQFRFYFRSYDGTFGLNNALGHDLNSVSGTASIMSGTNGLQHFAHIIVQELALLS